MDQLREFHPTGGIFAENMGAAQSLLERARRIVVLTGAGVSAESGVSTFRDADSGALWDKFNPEKMASMRGFAEDPGLVWEWYITRIQQVVKNAKPNDGHVALGQLEKIRHVRVITQNVDDLHECGGSHDVLHLHGDIQTARCHDDPDGILGACGWSGGIESLNLKAGEIPTCPECGNMARPNVVWFGERLDDHVLSESYRLLQLADLLIVAGTSGQVMPASLMPWHAKQAGAKIISVNTRESDHCSEADVRLTGKSGAVLRELASVVLK